MSPPTPTPPTPDQIAYRDKLRDPRWRRLAKQCKRAARYRCQRCGRRERALDAHHRWYAESGEPWDVPSAALVALCRECHDELHRRVPCRCPSMGQSFRIEQHSRWRQQLVAALDAARESAGAAWKQLTLW